jgi:hypothetical protein
LPGANNTAAVGGYDAYFGTYELDATRGTVVVKLEASLAPANIAARSFIGTRFTGRLVEETTLGDRPAVGNAKHTFEADLIVAIGMLLLYVEVVKSARRYGCLVFHDVTNVKHAKRALQGPNPAEWPKSIIGRHDSYWQTEANMAEGNPTMALERGEIDRIMEGVPRIERRKPLPDLRIAAADKHAETAD